VPGASNSTSAHPIQFPENLCFARRIA
jgi:hypothetical protein